MTQFNSTTTGPEVVSAFPEKVANKIFVITGGNSGIGAETVFSLTAAHPAQIILLGRSQDKSEPVLQKIRQASPATKATFVQVELASLDSVRKAAAQVNSLVPQIDVLINNAGIMGVKLSLTPEKVESQLATNHLGHFLLTNLLLPKLLVAAESGSARVVNLTSLMYQFSPVRFDDHNFSEGATYNTWEAYGQSKTANILFSVALVRRLSDKKVQSYSVHPGVIQSTNLASSIGPEDWAIVGPMFAEKQIAMPASKTIEEGCATTLVAALDPSLDDASGSFLYDSRIQKALDFASSPENAEKLWTLSEQLVGQKFE